MDPVASYSPIAEHLPVNSGEQAVHNKARLRKLERIAREEAQAHEQQRIALERQLQSAREQRSRCKSHHDRLSRELEELREETDELRQKRDWQNEERQRLRATLSDLSSRHQALEAEHRALLDQPVWREHVASSREAQLQYREDELAEQMRRMEQRQQSLDAREEQLVEMGRAARELGEKEAEFKQKQQEWEQQLERRQQKSEVNKENRRLSEMVQEQKILRSSLEAQLQRVQAAKSFITPGHYLKIARKHEGEKSAQENADLKAKHFGLETEVREVRRFNEVLRKHLPRCAWEAVAQELRALPCPAPRRPKAAQGKAGRGL